MIHALIELYDMRFQAFQKSYNEVQAFPYEKDDDFIHHGDIYTVVKRTWIDTSHIVLHCRFRGSASSDFLARSTIKEVRAP